MNNPTNSSSNDRTGIINAISDWMKLLALIVLIAEAVILAAMYATPLNNPWRSIYPIILIAFLLVIVAGVFVDRIAGIKEKNKNRPTSSVSASGQSPSIAVGSGGLRARDIDMSVNKAPTIGELKAQAETDKIERMLAQFDRKAVADWTHEEHINFMARSLNELRVNIQKEGIKNIQDDRVRERFLDIKDEVEQAVTLALLIDENSLAPIWHGGESILDLRLMGYALESDDLSAYYQGEGKQEAEKRFQMVYKFCSDRVKRLEKRPDDASKSLAHAMTIIYFFGAIDEIRRQIVRQTDAIRNHIGKPRKE